MIFDKENRNKLVEYQCEKECFFLLEYMASQKESHWYSDFNSYMIGSYFQNIWIWSKGDSFPFSFFEDFDCALEKGKNSITCRKEMFDFLTTKNSISKYSILYFYQCFELISPKKRIGKMMKAQYSDKDTLSRYWIENAKEGGENLSQMGALEEVLGWINSNCFYVLKDDDGEILSMAGYTILQDIAKITYVFTPHSYRNLSYCQNLVYLLSKKLLKDGYQVILYTTQDNIAANCAYSEIGFFLKEKLIEFSIEK